MLWQHRLFVSVCAFRCPCVPCFSVLPVVIDFCGLSQRRCGNSL